MSFECPGEVSLGLRRSLLLYNVLRRQVAMWRGTGPTTKTAAHCDQSMFTWALGSGISIRGNIWLHRSFS